MPPSPQPRCAQPWGFPLPSPPALPHQTQWRCLLVLPAVPRPCVYIAPPLRTGHGPGPPVRWVQDGNADERQGNPELARPCVNNSAQQTGRNSQAAGRLGEGRTYASRACALGRPQRVFNGRVRPLALTENQQQFICL